MDDKLRKFIYTWFPNTDEWDNIGKFILESGIQLTNELNGKWLTGYTNISRSHKPHHLNDYVRYMEETMFVLHDVVHQIFTLNVECSKEEYVKRQVYGELFTFYLTEYIIPSYFTTSDRKEYIIDRGCYTLIETIFDGKETNGVENIIDIMWDVFINGNITPKLGDNLKSKGCFEAYKKYSRMFRQDLDNSGRNYGVLPKGIRNYCIVGPTSQNHLDFFSAVSNGAIKNIKREFDLELPEDWI